MNLWVGVGTIDEMQWWRKLDSDAGQESNHERLKAVINQTVELAIHSDWMLY